MVNGSERDPETSGQLPLAELVARRREEKGLTLAAVARLMHRAAEADGDYCLATRQAIHEYEHGRRIPYNDSLRWLASALQLPFEEALAAARRQRAHRELLRAADSIREDAAGTDPPARPAWERLLLDAAACLTGDNEDVNRRQLLFDLAMLSLAAPLAGTEAVRQGLAMALGGDGHANLDEWDRIVHEYARSIYVTPADRLLPDLTADLSVLQLHLGGTDGAVQRSLARAGGQLAVMCAYAWRNAGDAARTRRWWRTARQLVDRSGDAEARIWMRGREVVSGLYEERPVPVILGRAAEATSISGSLVSAGSVSLYAGLAQTLAVAGRSDEALAALRQTSDLTDRLPARVVADEGSLFGWPEVALRHTESYVHTWLGSTRDAYAAQEAALQAYPESLVRNRATLLLHRSACMIQDGDVGGGLAYAGRVLDSLPAQHRTEAVYATGRAVMRIVPASERGRPEAAELRARLAFSSAGE